MPFGSVGGNWISTPRFSLMQRTMAPLGPMSSGKLDGKAETNCSEKSSYWISE